MKPLSFGNSLCGNTLILFAVIVGLPNPSSANPDIASLSYTIKNHGGVLSVAFSPDSDLIACGGENTIRIYKAKSGSLVHSFTEQNAIVNAVAFSPDGTLLATADDAGEVKMWNVQTGELELSIVVHAPHEMKSSHDYRALAVCFSPDGNMLASGSGGFECIDCIPYGEVKLWDAHTGKLLADFPRRKNYVWSIAFSRDGATMATSSAGSNVEIWDLKAGKVIKELVHNDEVIPLALSPEGKYLATGCKDKTVKIWDTKSWRVERVLSGHKDQIQSVAFTDDRKLISAGQDDEIIRVWNTDSGAASSILVNQRVSLNSIAVSPDRKTLAAGTADGILMVWQLQ